MHLLGRIKIARSSSLELDLDFVDTKDDVAHFMRDESGNLLIVQDYGTSDQFVIAVDLDELIEFIQADGYDVCNRKEWPDDLQVRQYPSNKT